MTAGVDRGMAMDALRSLLSDELVIGGLGNQSYDLYLAGDRPENFYMWGAMGIAPAVGLGVAVSAPGCQVVALEGDGGMFMNLGALATIGGMAPENLGVILFDNRVYDLTGGQGTASSRGADLLTIAQGCGIHRSDRVDSLEGFADLVKDYLSQRGPWLIVVDTAPTASARKKPLVELRERFMLLEPFVRRAAALSEGPR